MKATYLENTFCNSAKKLLAIFTATTFVLAGLLYGALSFLDDDIADAEDMQFLADSFSVNDGHDNLPRFFELTDVNGNKTTVDMWNKIEGIRLPKGVGFSLQPVSPSPANEPGSSVAGTESHYCVSIKTDGMRNHQPIHLWNDHMPLLRVASIQNASNSGDLSPDEIWYNIAGGDAASYSLLEVENNGGEREGEYLRNCTKNAQNMWNPWAQFKFKFYAKLPNRNAYVVVMRSGAHSLPVGLSGEPQKGTRLQTQHSSHYPLWVLDFDGPGKV